MRSIKNSLTEHPARPEEAQAQAQAQLDAQAQLEAQAEAQEDAQEEWECLPELLLCPPERRLPEEVLTGTLITFTLMKVLGLSPYL